MRTTSIIARKLTEMGYDADFVRVTGAEHEGNFWSRAVLDEIKEME